MYSEKLRRAQSVYWFLGEISKVWRKLAEHLLILAHSYNQQVLIDLVQPEQLRVLICVKRQ